MKDFAQTVSKKLHSGQNLVLATVVDSSGSTPRSSGAKMAVFPDGSIYGTVGGGVVEARARKLAGKLINEQSGTVCIEQISLDNKLAAETDMICGGRVTLVLEAAAPGSVLDDAYTKVGDFLNQSRKCVLFTHISGKPERARAIAHNVVDDPAKLPLEFSMDADGARAIYERALKFGTAKFNLGDSLVFVEAFSPGVSLFLFGAGHVSQATAKVAAGVGFSVTVLDDRAEFANADRFPDADQICVLNSFNDAIKGQPVDENSFAVVFTRGHAHDKVVLAQVLETPARYIGMIGSKTKRDAIYSALRSEGFGDDDLSRCHSPIGLKIGAQTPAEIAISIVAELIAVRAGKSE